MGEMVSGEMVSVALSKWHCLASTLDDGSQVSCELRE